MAQPAATIIIRKAQETDLSFIHTLSPVLAGMAKLGWHTDETVLDFQAGYITEIMAGTPKQNLTLIAEKDGSSEGFIHMREHKDEISGEACGTVPLLAVTEKAQGDGIGKLLIKAAENWAKAQGFRLLHLEVFSANKQARGFYQNLGFQEETINMIKPLK